jgi:hypothetical protein
LTISKSFTAVGVGTNLAVKAARSFSYTVSGTFVASWVLEKSRGGQTWAPVATGTGSASATVVVEPTIQGLQSYRFRCSAFTSGTMVTSMADVAAVVKEFTDAVGTTILRVKEDSVDVCVRTSQTRLTPASLGKPGGTSGFISSATDNISLATCPASKTGSTYVIPVTRLKVGDTITGFYLIGQIESAGNTATVDANLRKHTAAAADVADASVASMTQVSVSADTALTVANTAKTGLSQVVGADESYYVLVTVTTAAATDVALQALAVTVTEA